MDFDIDIDELAGGSKVFFLDTNLSSPVLLTEIEDTKSLIRDVCLKNSDSARFYRDVPFFKQGRVAFLHKLCKTRQWSQKLLKEFRPLLPEQYGIIESDMCLSQIRTKGLFYSESQHAAQELEDALCDGLRARGLPTEEIRGTASLLCSEPAKPWRIAYEEFCNMFARAESRVKRSPDTWSTGTVGEVQYWINAKNALIMLRGEMYYSSLNQVLMLKDKLATRFMMLEHIGPLGLSTTLVTPMLSLFSWQDDTLEFYGNQAYNLLKAVEPMFKTWLSHNVDNIFGNDTAYTRMKIKMQEKEEAVCRKLGRTNSNKMQGLYDIVERVTDTRSIVEMFGCLKTCGHPLIDTEAGGLSAAEAARTPDRTSLVDAQKLRNTFCHIVLTSYISQHGCWPKLYHAHSGTALKKLNDQQLRNLTRKSYPLSDWNTTEWTKLFDFDYFPNFLDLMDDKSISLYRSDKHLSWDKGTPKTNRRLLLEVLSRKNVDVESIVKQVSSRKIPDDWKIVSLYPKEREFKLEPRMFAMLVLEMRCFFTAVEANIASNIFKYLPQQTMTKTKTQNQERFLRFTDPTKNKTDYTLFLEIDLTRWNLMWRELVIHMLGHDFNQMFGVQGTFTVTHWFFSIAQILVRVPNLRPEGVELENPPETNLAWKNHKGGFEGLNQKLWTAATYAMVEMALAPILDKNIISDYEVIGQGDNQVVRVSIPSAGKSREDIIPAVRDMLNDALEKTCASVNQEVKPEENIESTAVLTYSKDVLVKGVEYPTSLKKHSRLFPVTSMDFPSVVSNARAILAGSTAGGENALYPLRSAIIGHYHAYRYLIAAGRGWSIHAHNYPQLSHLQLQTALVVPSSIGGLCGPAYASYFYKGGSDPLGKEISGLRFLAESNNTVGRIASSSLKAIECKYWVSEEPNLEILLDNPYGLPLETPSSALSRVGHLTLEAFRGAVVNADINSLLRTTVSDAEKTLRKDLVNIRPLNPILAHDLFDASGFGTVKLMRKMFVHTRTIQTIAQVANPLITHTFLRADLNAIASFLSWHEGLPVGKYTGIRSFELTTKARGYWGVPLHGVNNHQPLDFTHYSQSLRPSSCLIWSAHSASNVLDTRGPLTGYIGTATREKRSEHGYKIVDTGAPSRALMKLQLIRSQAYGSKQFNCLLDQISLTRSPVALSRVTDVLPKVIGGSISHRYASSIRSMAASYVGPLNFATHIRIDTDNIDKISGSADNYPVMLQEFIIMAQAGAKLKFLHENCQAGGLHLPFQDLEPLIDDSMTCDAVKFQHREMPKSKLLYSQSLSLRRTLDNSTGSVPIRQVVQPSDYATKESIWLGLIGFFMSTLRDQNRAKTIADNRGHASLPARFQLDISEAHAVGPSQIIKSISYAIILSTVRDTFRTLQLHPDRWDESLFLAHNIKICLKACGAYFHHPLFNTHKDAFRYRASALRYASSMNLEQRLTAAVRRDIATAFGTPGHSIWRQEIPIFSGDHSSALVEAVTLSAAMRIRELYTTGDSNSPLFTNLFSSYMRVSRDVANSTGQTLELVRLRCTQLASLFSRHGDELLSKEFLNLAHLSGVKVFNDDQRTVLRNARSLTPDVIIKTASRARAFLPDPTDRIDHCSQCIPGPQSVNMVIWDRNRQRINGGLSSAGYTWIHVLPYLTLTSSTLIVGNGNGGLANLLLNCYDTSVVGLDLEKDMPDQVATLLNYIPPGIELHNRDRFIQSDWSINSTGSWLEDQVRNGTLSSLPRVSTIFLDMTGPDLDSIVETLEETMRHPLVESIAARLIGDADELFDVVKYLRQSFEVQIWIVSRSTSSTEGIVSITRSQRTLHSCNDSCALIHREVSNRQHALIPSLWSELLEAATMSAVRWETESTHEAFCYLRNLCKSLLNKPKTTQLTYKDRYALLIGYAVLFAVNSESPVSTLQEWISDEEIDTDLYTYKLNQATVTHLLRYVPRLLYHTKNSLLAT
ncbi:RNA-dependent RNA polymerase [Erysiphe necator associated negative-stranded RNA virus 6]|uniref:RNA-dependent RNA polymerase n=1 Tax=Erysiphe necator associated negative-stranded RNA virus 6 TaxID=2737073 RepID=UPI002481DF34|nr:RNA-dependent RNA polymerase [Erysiphe necator associated negative-stranded RNA virus 6]QJW70354.1 RNA-dependent RNA polymerase [Erysiphe necator associated negative-stranded RNA virus 6]